MEHWKDFGIERLCYRRLSTYRVLTENNIAIEDKLWNNTTMKMGYK